MNPLASLVRRNMIVLWQVVGTFFAVISLLVYILEIQTVADLIPAGLVEQRLIVGAILSVLVYFTWKTIYTAIVIIRFVKREDDLTISNNRYIMSALSLNLGGIFTPFMLTSLPNIDVQSTINPRWFLSRVMGMTVSIGSVIALVSFFLDILAGPNALTVEMIFASTTTWITLGVYLAIFAVGIVTISTFYSRNRTLMDFEALDNKKSNLFPKLLGYFWMGIITIELALTIWMAVVRLLGFLADAFKGSDMKSGNTNWLMIVLRIIMALPYMIMSLIHTFWVVLLSVRTMRGLWSRNGMYSPTYQTLFNATMKSRTYSNQRI